VKRQKSAPNRALNGLKNRIGKGRGVRVEGTTKVTSIVEPRREKDVRDD